MLKHHDRCDCQQILGYDGDSAGDYATEDHDRQPNKKLDLIFKNHDCIGCQLILYSATNLRAVYLRRVSYRQKMHPNMIIARVLCPINRAPSSFQPISDIAPQIQYTDRCFSLLLHSEQNCQLLYFVRFDQIHHNLVHLLVEQLFHYSVIKLRFLIMLKLIYQGLLVS